MGEQSRLTRLSPGELDSVLAQAKAERWTRLVLIGPRIRLSERSKDWPEQLRAERQVFQLIGYVERLGRRLGTLSDLSSLRLWDGGVDAEGARAIAASLTGLTSFRLWSNNIDHDGVRTVLDAYVSRESRQLWLLDLRENPGIDGLLPKEVFESYDNPQAILAAYRRFVAAEQAKDLRPLNELKLLVVGNETVGKTSLLHYLVEDRPRDPAEARTPGIVQHEKIRIELWSPSACDVQLNIWDFGGQEMLRGTHRFFLTERSLYLLVLGDRRQDDRAIYEWMKTCCPASQAPCQEKELRLTRQLRPRHGAAPQTLC